MSLSGFLCPRSELLNTDFRSDTCIFLVFGAHFKYVEVIKINPVYTGMCRDFLRGRGSNVKKGTSVITNIQYNNYYIYCILHNKIHTISLYMHTLYKVIGRCKHVTMIDIVNRLCGLVVYMYVKQINCNIKGKKLR